ncbi:MAG: hypothetical protein WCP32_04390 [Bacteroidota bacterium]
MKRLLFAVLTFAAASFTWGQSYHPLVETGKVWSTIHNYFPGLIPYSDYVKFQGDTTINGLTYKKVWRSVDALQSTWTSDGFIREDNSRHVYYMTWAGGPANNLLYDFSARTGDTVNLFYDPMGIYFIVDSVDNTTLLTGETRSRLFLSAYAVGGFLLGHDIWVEGMGSLFGVLQSGSCALVGDNPALLCFHENDTLKYFLNGFSTCFVTTGTGERLANDIFIRVFPNPTTGQLSIRVYDPATLPLKVIFSDPAGKKILEKTLVNEVSEVDLTGHPSSTEVFYSISGSGGVVSTGKIIFIKQ